MVEKIAIFGCLFGGFLLLFQRMRWLKAFRQLLKQTRDSMEEAARQRMLQSRKTLLTLQKEKSLWISVERQLQYSGLQRRFPFLTAELWVVGNLAGVAFLFAGLQFLLPDWRQALLIVFLAQGVEGILLVVLKAEALRSVERNLLKFLDFLGNYSITAGEITGIFKQVSRYMEEPLKSALDECCFEAQTTGDVSMALLSMAEKIEHPQWKELVRNIEISMRYSADFSVLVHTSRRSVREYLKAGSERKNMLREALVNMMLLLAMSVFILLIVDGLVEQSVWKIVFFTLPGRICFGLLVFIFLLFARQIYKMNQ